MDISNTELVEDLRALGLNNVADLWLTAMGATLSESKIIRVDFREKRVIHGYTKKTEETVSRI